MSLSFLIPTTGKILGIIILLCLTSIPGIIPPITDPTICMQSSCTIYIGAPLVYLNVKAGVSTTMSLEPILTNLIIDVIVFYLVVSILSYLFGKKENKEIRKEEQVVKEEQNVPNSVG